MDSSDLEVFAELLEALVKAVEQSTEQQKRIADVLEAMDKHGIYAFPKP